ncbi:FtsB family cell division protein [Pseudolysinimonas kribbensis]|nr:septum formation initiator family protein [Pseudolysinimonas kribbensis]
MARPGRTERVAVAMPDESRPAAWLRGFRLSGFALSSLLLIVAALVVLAPNLKTLVEQRQQIAQLQQEVAQSKKDVKDLRAQVDRWKDPAYVAAQARTKLYYVMPGDVSYFVVNTPTTPTTPDGLPVSDRIQTADVDWVHSLLQTTFAAGLTDATPSQLDSGTIPSPTQK